MWCLFLLLWGGYKCCKCCKYFTPAAPVPCPLPTDVAAQAAVVSERLRGVLGDSSDENEAAPLNSPVPVTVPAPRLAPSHQSVSTICLGLRNSGAGQGKMQLDGRCERLLCLPRAGNTFLLLCPLSCPAQTVPVF